MPSIVATTTCFPANYYSQEEITNTIRKLWFKHPAVVKKLEKFHHNAGVHGRHLALPLEAYQMSSGFGARNSAWIKVALDLGEQTLCTLLEKTLTCAEAVNHLTFTTVTGIAVPSIDARLMNRIPFSKNLKRMPLFGLGCMGGAAGVARVADYLQGHPDEAAVLLSVELCSLTIQYEDLSIANLISSGLFGDGAAAIMLVGNEHPLARKGQARVIDNRSVFFPDTEYIMGWDVRDSGLKMILSGDVAEVVEAQLRPAIQAFLGSHDLEIRDIRHWIAHPGGPKVIEALEHGLDLKPDMLHLSRESLAEVGNLSSASVLVILDTLLAGCQPEAGQYGLMMAMGPGFNAELVLLQW